MPATQPHADFVAAINDVVSHFEQIAAAITNSESRPGYLPRGQRIRRDDLENLTSALNFLAVADDYSGLWDASALSGQLAASKIQVEFVRMLVRAHRARRASPLRAFAHQTARLRGLGHIRGPLGRVMTYVQDLQAAAAQAANSRD